MDNFMQPSWGRPVPRVPDVAQRKADPIIDEIENILGPALPVELTGPSEEGRRDIAARMNEMKVDAETAINSGLRRKRR